MAAGKKQGHPTTAIPSWCLEVSLVAPAHADVDEMREHLASNHDTARLPEVATLAAFALLACDPATGQRHFSMSNLPLLAMRNRLVIEEVLAIAPTLSKPLIATLDEALKKKSPKTPTKKAK